MKIVLVPNPEAVAAAVMSAPIRSLMENAYKKPPKKFHSSFPVSLPPSELYGKGNMGGDDWSLPAITQKRAGKCVFRFCGNQASLVVPANLELLPNNVSVLSADKLEKERETVRFVDGVFGIGFHGELLFPTKGFSRKANRCKAYRIALDLPSGYRLDTGETSPKPFVRVTFTFGA
jgi:NAD(P)H-hydrate repair Nnr-like enzyme with NAD(P)H-hydrate epimerase domain